CGRIRDGHRLRTRCRAVWRARPRGRAHVGQHHTECVARGVVPVRLLARHVLTVAGRGVCHGRRGAAPPRGSLDGAREAGIRAPSARRCRVLPHLNGKTPRMKNIRKLAVTSATARLTLLAGALLVAGSSALRAQESGIAMGAMAPAAAVVTLDGMAVDLQ